MTLPRLTDVGDTLMGVAPQLGAGLRSIFRPEADLEDAFKAELARDPMLFDKLVALDKTNPGAVANIYGKKAQQMITGRELLPETKNKRVQVEQDIEINKQKIAENNNKLKIIKENDKVFANFAKKYPDKAQELMEWRAQEAITGTTADELELTKHKIGEIEKDIAASDTARKFITKHKTLPGMYKAIFGNTDPDSGDVSEPLTDPNELGALRSAKELEGFWQYANNRLDKERQDFYMRKQEAAQNAIALRAAKADEARIKKAEEKADTLNKKALAKEIDFANAKVDAGLVQMNKLIGIQGSKGISRGVNIEGQIQPLLTQVNEHLANRAKYKRELTGEDVLPNTAELVITKGTGILGTGIRPSTKYQIVIKDAEGNILDNHKLDKPPKTPKKNKKEKEGTDSTNTTTKLPRTSEGEADFSKVKWEHSGSAKQILEQIDGDDVGKDAAYELLDKYLKGKQIKQADYDVLKEYVDSWEG